jgi:hypothetical protein
VLLTRRPVRLSGAPDHVVKRGHRYPGRVVGTAPTGVDLIEVIKSGRQCQGQRPATGTPTPSIASAVNHI